MPFVPFRVGRKPYTARPVATTRSTNAPTNNYVDDQRLRRIFDFVNSLVTATGDFLLGDVTVGRGGGRIVTNAAIGRNALKLNTTGNNNCAVGNEALTDNTTGLFNTAIGSLTLQENTGGNNNVSVGHGTISVGTSTTNATAIGLFALRDSTSSNRCVAVGANAGLLITTAVSNVAIGAQSLSANLTGADNVAVGDLALAFCTAGNNVAVGSDSFLTLTTGTNCVAVGNSAGRYHANGVTPLTTPANSVYLGAESRALNNSDSNSIVIGYQSIGEGANTTVIGNSSTLTAHIYGLLQTGFATKTITNSDSPYTVLAADHTIICDCTSGAITVNLIAAATASGSKINIKKSDASANAVTIDGSGAETIDGATTKTLSTRYDSLTIHCDGTEWWIL